MNRKFPSISLAILAALALMAPQAIARVVVSGVSNPGNRNRVHPGIYIPGGGLPVYRPAHRCPRMAPPPPPCPRHRAPARIKVKSPDRYTPDGYLKPSTKAPHRVQDGPLQPRR